MWPRMSQQDFNTLVDRIRGRLGKLAPRFVQAQTTSPFLRAFGRIGLRFAQGRVLKFVRLAILSDLVRRDQIEGWELPAPLPQLPGTPPDYARLADNERSMRIVDDIRMVLAELANPAFTFRTARGIAAKTHLERDFVDTVLRTFLKTSIFLNTPVNGRSYAAMPYVVWKGEHEGQRSSPWPRAGRTRSGRCRESGNSPTGSSRRLPTALPMLGRRRRRSTKP